MSSVSLEGTEARPGKPEDVPPSVLHAFKALTAEGANVVLMCTRTREGGPYHHLLAVVDGEGSATPLAVIPAARSMHGFLTAIEKIGPSADPDFKGVRM